MTKEERLDLLRQERITRQLMTHIVDSMYESEYSILFNLQDEIIEDKGRNTSYPHFFNEIDVSDSYFTTETFINMVMASYTNCQIGRDQTKYYLPPSLDEIMEFVIEFYEEIMASTIQETIDERFIQEGREDEIGGEEYTQELDDEYELVSETIYSYECADLDYRVASVLENYGLVYMTEVYGKSPFVSEHYSYKGIYNSSKRLLFEEYTPELLTDLSGFVEPAPREDGEINVAEDVERGYLANIREDMAFKE